MPKMKSNELGASSQCREEIRGLIKTIDDLKRLNSELEQKVLDIYGEYETLQYTFRGQCQVYGTEIVKLRQEIERLRNELRARGWVEK